MTVKHPSGRTVPRPHPISTKHPKSAGTFRKRSFGKNSKPRNMNSIAKFERARKKVFHL